MVRTVIAFTFGVFFAQEFHNALPNVKTEGLILYNQFLTSEFYKKVKDDYNKKN